MTTNEEDFLAELTKLTQKYNIEIGGCGCCGSPWLAARETTEIGRYIINHDYSEQIVYVEPGDYYWKTNKVSA